MTSINLFAHGTRGLVMTDTAAYDDDGRVHSFISKSIAIPRLKMAMATRGMILMLPLMASRLDVNTSSFDDVIDRGAAFLKGFFIQHAGEAGTVEEDVEVSAVGWSESRKQCLAIQLSSMDVPGRPAFTWSTSPILIMPAPHHQDLIDGGVLVDGVFDERNIEASLLKVMEIQRGHTTHLGADPSRPKRHTVGGQAIVTEVTEHGVSQRIVRTWPDQLGQHIEPAPPANVVPMSREQQRRLKQKRRAG